MVFLNRLCFLLALMALCASLAFAGDTQYASTQYSKCSIDINSISFDGASRQLSLNFVVINTSADFLDNLSFTLSMYGEKTPGIVAQKGFNLANMSFTKDYSGAMEGILPSAAKRFQSGFGVPADIDSGDYYFNIYVVQRGVDPCGFAYSQSPVHMEGTGGHIPGIYGYMLTSAGQMGFLDGIGVAGDRGVSLVFPLWDNPELAKRVSAGEKFYGEASVAPFSGGDGFAKKFERAGLTSLTDANGAALGYDINLAAGERLLSGPYTISFSLIDGKDAVVATSDIRWVVAGFASRVSDVNMQKNSFDAGDPLLLTIMLGSLLDGSALGSAKIDVTLNGENGEKLGFSKTATGMGPLSTVDFSSEKVPSKIAVKSLSIDVFDAANPSRKLDSYTMNTPSPVVVAAGGGAPAAENPLQGSWLILMAAIAIIAIAIAGFLMIRKKRSGAGSL